MFLSVVLPFSTTKTKREQPKPRREWQYNAEKHKGKASASRVSFYLCFLFLTDASRDSHGSLARSLSRPDWQISLHLFSSVNCQQLDAYFQVFISNWI